MTAGDRGVKAVRNARHDGPARAARAPHARAGLTDLQRLAGNRAVSGLVAGQATDVQRWIERKGGSKATMPAKDKKNRADWKENDRKPVGVYLVQDKGKWWSFDFNKREWREYTRPVEQAAALPPPAVVATPAVPKEDPSKPMAGGRSPLTEAATGPAADQVMAALLSHLPAQDLANVRVLNQALLAHGSTAMREYFQRRFAAQGIGKTFFTGVSSLSPRFQETLVSSIRTRSPDKLVIVSDQVSPDVLTSMAQGVVGKAVVFKGKDRDGRRGAAAPGGKVESVTDVGGPTSDFTSKMHLKSAVGSKAGKPKFLISGSPNFTRAAMTKNTESAAVIDFPGIATLYDEYVGLVREQKNPSSAEGADFAKRLAAFNARNPTGVRAALAPFVNIGDQLDLELAGANKVIIRMFLVSAATSTKGADPVQTLINLRKGGATVEVVVDYDQARKQDYVRTALERLQRGGVSVSFETSKPTAETGPPGIMHDKLVLAKFKEDKETGRKARRTVMIGSSGLTENVMKDLNYENLLIIDDAKLYREFEAHHTAAEPQREAGIPARPRCAQDDKEMTWVKKRLPPRNRKEFVWQCPDGHWIRST